MNAYLKETGNPTLKPEKIFFKLFKKQNEKTQILTFATSKKQKNKRKITHQKN